MIRHHVRCKEKQPSRHRKYHCNIGACFEKPKKGGHRANELKGHISSKHPTTWRERNDPDESLSKQKLARFVREYTEHYDAHDQDAPQSAP